MAGGVSGAGMGRLMGFGFLFGAQDAGATRTAEEVKENVEGINTAATRTGREGSRGLQRFGNALSALNLAQLGRISSTMSSIADRAGAMSEVSTTSLESWGAQASLTYRQVTAGMGDMRGEMDAMRGEMMGVAHSLQMDVGQIAQLGRAVVTAGTSFEEMGLTVRGAAGAIQAGIIDAEGFGGAVREMTHHLGLSGEEVGNLMDDFTALGEQVGEGTAFVGQMPQMVQGIREATAEFPVLRRHSGELLRSLGVLARGMHEVTGASPAESVAEAGQVFQRLVQSRRGLRDLFTGMGSDFDELATQLGIGSGDIGEALEMVMSDPAHFAVRAARLFQEAGGTGSNMGERLRGVLAQMGPQFLRLIDGSEESREALAAMSQEMGDTSGAFERMARSASGSTRTFAESMDLLRERFQNQLNMMVRSMPGYRNFERRVLQRQRSAYDRLSDRVETLASRRGPLGALTRTMLAMRRGGVGGLSLALETELGRAFPRLGRQIADVIPLVGDMGSGMLEAAGQVAPLLIAMQQLRIPIPSLSRMLLFLVNPITLVAGALALMAIRGDRLQGDIQRLQSRLEGLSGQFVVIASVMRRSIEDINWVQMGNDLVNGFLQAIGVVTSGQAQSKTAANIGAALGDIFSALTTMIRGLARGMWDRTIQWITEPEGGWAQFRRGGAVAGTALGAALLTPMRGAIIASARFIFGGMGRTIARIATSGWHGTRGVLGGLRFAVGSAGGVGRIATGIGLRGAARTLGGAIPGLGAILGVLFDLPQIIDRFRTDGITAGLQQVLHSIINGLLLGIPDLVRRFTGFDIIETIFDILGFSRMMEAIRGGDWGEIIMEGLFNLFNGVLLGLPGLFRTTLEGILGEDVIGSLFGNVREGAAEVWDIITEFFGAIRDDWVAIAEPVWDSMVMAFQEVYATFSEVFGEIRDIFVDLWQETFRPILNDLWREFRSVFQQSILPMVRQVWAGIARWFDTYWNDHIIPGLENGVRNIARGFQWMSETGAQAFGRAATFIINRIFDITGAIVSMRERWEWFRDTLTASANYVGEVLRGALTVPFMRANQAITSIAHEIQNAFDVLRLSAIDMAQSMVDAIGAAVRRLPGGELLAQQFQPAIDAVSEYRRQQATEVTRRRQQRQEESRAQQAELDERLSRIREAESAARSAYESGRQRVAAAEASNEANRRRAQSAVREAVASTSVAFDEVSRRLEQLSTAEGRAQAQRERAQRRAAQAREVVEALQGAAGRGISEEVRRAIAGAAVSAAERGEEIDVQSVLGQVAAIRTAEGGEARGEATRAVLGGLGVEVGAGGGDAGGGRGRREPQRRASRSQAAHAQRQVRREQGRQEQTRELANEMMITSFGPEAVRQLTAALTIQVTGGGRRLLSLVEGEGGAH